MTLIAFYEKQGIKIYPGAKRWIIGNLSEMRENEKIRKTNELVEGPFRWMIKNMAKFADKKDEVKDWYPLILLKLMNKVKIYVADP